MKNNMICKGLVCQKKLKTYRLHFVRTECYYEEEEAEKLADENYSDYNWSDVDGTLNTEICFGETEKEIE